MAISLGALAFSVTGSAVDTANPTFDNCIYIDESHRLIVRITGSDYIATLTPKV